MMLQKIDYCLMFVMIFSLTQACEPDWFGRGCQYQRHCANNTNCDATVGFHNNDSKCNKGWFGPGCQYVDLLDSISSVTTQRSANFKVLMDRDDETCMMNFMTDQLKITWDQPHIITWMRFYLSNTVVLPSFDIAGTDTTLYTDSKLLPCREVMVSTRIVDVHCDPVWPAVIQVTISSRNVTDLCSLYISGGRNVAIKQKTSQTSTIIYEGVSLTSDLAVDGNTKGYLGGQVNKSCSSTKFGDPMPTWQVLLTPPKRIYFFVVHNRDRTQLKYRLSGFTLTSFSEDGSVVFNFTDSDTTGRDLYHITMTSPQVDVSSVRIQVPSHGQAILALCEVQIFGDSACPVGTYGLDCEHTCKCQVKDEICYVNTGSCHSGCVDDMCTVTRSEETKSAAGSELFIGIGVGVTILITMISIVIVWLCVRNTKKPQSQVYDLPEARQEPYSHDYDTIAKTVVPTGSTTTTLHNSTYDKTIETSLYDYIDDDHEYV